ncbi:MAG: hypothetical protein HY703_12390 [Gemmatimonadetes bacterium]|nr:hypothetical protein [Gemmatimonadota bacterium]
MVKRRAWKRVDRAQWMERRRNAQDYLQAARDLLALTPAGGNGNPIMSQALLAVIACADALTIKFAGIQNTQDHRAAVAALKQVLGQRADPSQLARLERMMASKDDIQYDHRTATIEEARDFVAQAERFALWAERELARP